MHSYATTYCIATDNNGNFYFDDLPPGTYTVWIHSPGLVSVHHIVSVSEGQSLSLGTVLMSPITEQELLQAVQDAVESWDSNGNGKIDFADVIFWLEVLGGVRIQP